MNPMNTLRHLSLSLVAIMAACSVADAISPPTGNKGTITTREPPKPAKKDSSIPEEATTFPIVVSPPLTGDTEPTNDEPDVVIPTPPDPIPDASPPIEEEADVPPPIDAGAMDVEIEAAPVSDASDDAG